MLELGLRLAKTSLALGIVCRVYAEASFATGFNAEVSIPICGRYTRLVHKGASRNSDSFVAASKHCAQNRSVLIGT